VELALLSSTLAKALAGPRYDDYSRTETLQMDGWADGTRHAMC
jgi:hypothetical protein